jgi:hypothetical protein
VIETGAVSRAHTKYDIGQTVLGREIVQVAACPTSTCVLNNYVYANTTIDVRTEGKSVQQTLPNNAEGMAQDGGDQGDGEELSRNILVEAARFEKEKS